MLPFMLAEQALRGHVESKSRTSELKEGGRSKLATAARMGLGTSAGRRRRSTNANGCVLRLRRLSMAAA